MNTILLFGSNGLLGNDIRKKAEGRFNIIAPSSSECDLLKPGIAAEFIERISPDIIINSAAMTNVDDAELHKEKAMQINAYAVREIAKAAKEKNILFVHISTDYVFNGTSDRPYSEEDPRNAANFYGYTKVMAEEFIQEAAEDMLIFRVAWLIGKRRKTLFDMIREFDGEHLKIIDDQWGDPTFSFWAAEIILESIEKSIPRGIYNLTSSANITRYEFARKLKEKLGLKFELSAIGSTALKRPALRPRATSLINQKLSMALKRNLPSWEEQLDLFLQG